MMREQPVRSVLWVVLALLIAAQTQAVDPPDTAAPATSAQTDAEADTPLTKTVEGDLDPGRLSKEPTAPAAGSAWALTSNIVIPTGSDIAVIPVSGVIYDFTYESLQRRVDKAVADGAALIVIELDTPGGVVTSALKISKYIKSLNVPTVAWVNSEAYSAGIMLAAACDEIVMSPSSATGDCAPILPGGNLEPTERAKLLSPILEEFRDSAQANGYDYAMFHAMCVLGVEVYLVEKDDGSGERRLVNQVDYAVMVKGESPNDQPSSSPSPATSPGTSLPALQDVGAVTLSTATNADRGAWRPVEVLPSGAKAPFGQVHDGKTLLTMNQTRALDVGLSKQTVTGTPPIQSRYSAANVVTIAPTWSEGIARVLTSWWMRIILVVVCLVAGYIELQAPGLSVPGGIAVVAAVLLFGAPFIIGLAEFWHILLFVLGFALLIIEVLFAPTVGVLGVVGLLMMFMGVVLSVVPSGLPVRQFQTQTLTSAFVTMVALILSGVGFYFVTRHFGKIPGLNRMILQAAQPAAGAVGLDEAGRPLHVSGDEVLGVGVVEVGLGGEAVTELRPSGMARFAGHDVDVVSVGPFIEPGDPVRVIEVKGNRIVVDRA